MTRARFQSILQNLYFSNEVYVDKTDKSNEIRSLIEHLNKLFAESLPNGFLERVDEHMCKLS